MRFTYEVRISCDDIGRRVSVRSRSDAGGYADVVGVLETCDEETFGIRDRSGALRSVPRAGVVAAKVVTAPPSGG